MESKQRLAFEQRNIRPAPHKDKHQGPFFLLMLSPRANITDLQDLCPIKEDTINP